MKLKLLSMVMISQAFLACNTTENQTGPADKIMDLKPQIAGREALVGRGSRLYQGQSLRTNEYLSSPNGQYFLIVQGDGNIVQYDASGRALWATNTRAASFFGSFAFWGSDVVSRLTMQNDGNLVAYSECGSAWWMSKTNAGSFLQIQDDGNIVMYWARGALWSKWNTGYITRPASVFTCSYKQGLTVPW